MFSARAVRRLFLHDGSWRREDIVFTFENEASLAGWSTSYLRYNFDPGCFYGYAFEKSANLSDPMFISPILDINAEDYRYVVVNMRFSIDAAWSRTGTVFSLFRTAHGTAIWRSAANVMRTAPWLHRQTWCSTWPKAKTGKGRSNKFDWDPFEAPGTIERIPLPLRTRVRLMIP